MRVKFSFYSILFIYLFILVVKVGDTLKRKMSWARLKGVNIVPNYISIYLENKIFQHRFEIFLHFTKA